MWLLFYFWLFELTTQPAFLVAFLNDSQNSLQYHGCTFIGDYLLATYTSNYNFDNYSALSCHNDNITSCESLPCVNNQITCAIIDFYDIVNLINYDPIIRNNVSLYGKNQTGSYLLSNFMIDELTYCKLKRCNNSEPTVVFVSADFDKVDERVLFSTKKKLRQTPIYDDRVVEFVLRNASGGSESLFHVDVSTITEMTDSRDFSLPVKQSCNNYSKICGITTWSYCDDFGQKNQNKVAETCRDLENTVDFPQISQFTCWLTNSTSIDTLVSVDSKYSEIPYWYMYAIQTTDGIKTFRFENTASEHQILNIFALNSDNIQVNVSVCTSCGCSTSNVHTCTSYDKIENPNNDYTVVATTVSIAVLLLIICSMLYFCIRKKKYCNNQPNQEEITPDDRVFPTVPYTDVDDPDVVEHSYDSPVPRDAVEQVEYNAESAL